MAWRVGQLAVVRYSFGIREHEEHSPVAGALLEGLARGGGVGEECTISSYWEVWGVKHQTSTCGSVHVPETITKSLGTTEPSYQYADVNLRCYQKDSKELVKEEGSTGVCKIPRTKSCDPAVKGACRHATECRKETSTVQGMRISSTSCVDSKST
eukprot:TRINITY_DN14401_c0_g1_i1.p1 TRINITY_DN14401_c0_g1~~TRINITY_DN14401_c0_g1_i1.p1  ORF type:complete len:155 (-),score=6.46 TRINITY_DN14401_c0_g1_i1:184-648(-)